MWEWRSICAPVGVGVGHAGHIRQSAGHGLHNGVFGAAVMGRVLPGGAGKADKARMFARAAIMQRTGFLPRGG